MGPRGKNSCDGILIRGPSKRKSLNSVDDWLEGKWIDDGAEGLWRVHDKLYDLTTYIKKHPGGRGWLEATRGTDVTEAFECHHLTDRAEKILSKFYVRDAAIQRNSLITFHENGFFRTLKRKIKERNLMPDTRPLLKTKLLADTLAVSVFVTGLLGTVYNYKWAIASGVLLNMLSVCAHNFFHMKDNWRMYYFNLSLMSVSETAHCLHKDKDLFNMLVNLFATFNANSLLKVKNEGVLGEKKGGEKKGKTAVERSWSNDWRVSHVLSHHLYPNTTLDLEISMFEPLFRFLPREGKKLRYLSFLFCPIVMPFMGHFQFFKRIVDVISGKKLGFKREELVGISLFLFLFVFSGQSPSNAFLTWNVIIITSSFFFSLIGLTAAHHHPDIYHDGDFLGDDKDFGLLQLAAVRNRFDVDGNFMKTMIMFGEHALHHMFPTIDHGRLTVLDSVFQETCEEFRITYKPLPAKSLVVGMFRQLIRNYRNTRLMILED